MYKMISYIWFLSGAACYLVSIFVSHDRYTELLLMSACNLLFAIWFKLLSKEDK